MPEEDLVELFRSQDPDAMRHVIDILDKAKIPHQFVGDEGGFDFMAIGSDEEAENILNIRVSDFDAARKALETDSLQSDLPADHHLNQASDDDLLDIISHASEWSPFDVAHSRRLLEEHGVDTAKLQEDRKERITRLKQGRPASKMLIFFGWVFALLGGIIGIAIGLSLHQTKDKTSVGEFYRYDEASRTKGEFIFKIGVIGFLIAVIIRVFYWKD